MYEDLERMDELRRLYRYSLLWTYVRNIIITFRSHGHLTNSALVDAVSARFPSLEGLHWRPRRNQSPAFLPPVLDNIVAAKGIFKHYARFPLLTRLSFSQHNFHSFVDLWRICASLPQLQELYLDGISWTHVPHSIPPFSPSRERQLHRVTAYNCQEIWSLVWLWASDALISRPLLQPQMRYSQLFARGNAFQEPLKMTTTLTRTAVFELRNVLQAKIRTCIYLSTPCGSPSLTICPDETQ